MRWPWICWRCAREEQRTSSERRGAGRRPSPPASWWRESAVGGFRWGNRNFANTLHVSSRTSQKGNREELNPVAAAARDDIQGFEEASVSVAGSRRHVPRHERFTTAEWRAVSKASGMEAEVITDGG